MKSKAIKRMIVLMLALILIAPAVFVITACGEGEHSHVFDKEKTDVKYRKSAATCTEPAVYYKSCECGEVGTETFTSGKAKGHDYELIMSGNYKTVYLTGEQFDAADLTVTRTCLSCNETSTITDYEIVPDGALSSTDGYVTIKVDDVTEMIQVKVRSAVVTNAEIAAEGDRIIYTLSGICVGDLTKEELWFDLNTYKGYVYCADQNNITVETTATETEGTYNFTMSADVTDIQASKTAFYPHLHVDGMVEDVTNFTEDWNNSVTLGNSKYSIYHNNTLAAYPWGMPVVIREYTGQDFPKENNKKDVNMEGVWFTYDSVKLESDETNVWMVVEGRHQDCTYETLSSAFNIQVRKGSENFRTFIEDGVLEIMKNSYKAKINITNLSSTGSTPYYTRRMVKVGYENEMGAEWQDQNSKGQYIGNASGKGIITYSNGTHYDLDTEVGLQKNDIDTTPVTLESKTYRLVYEAAHQLEDASKAYGNVGLVIE